jgi:hypothetical protein
MVSGKCTLCSSGSSVLLAIVSYLGRCPASPEHSCCSGFCVKAGFVPLPEKGKQEALEDTAALNAVPRLIPTGCLGSSPA